MFFYGLPVGLDCLRAMIGPLPTYVCELVIFSKNFAHSSLALFALAHVIAKFTFVCVYKSIPVFDDVRWAKYIFYCVHITGFITVLIMTIYPGKPPLNYVSSTIRGNNVNL